MTPEDWDSGFGRCVGGVPQRRGDPGAGRAGQRVVDDSFLLCFNAHDEPIDFVTPDGRHAQEWTLTLDTDIADGRRTPTTVAAGESVTVQARSVLVLRKTE